MKNIEYDSSMPLQRLEKGDKAIIRFGHFPESMVSERDKKKYKDIPTGDYIATYLGNGMLECKEQPILSGKYCFWHGNKWGCSENIYADEIKD